MVPLGYDTKDRKISVNEAEADRVRTIFRSYLRLSSLSLLMASRSRAVHLPTCSATGSILGRWNHACSITPLPKGQRPPHLGGLVFVLLLIHDCDHLDFRSGIEPEERPISSGKCPLRPASG
jgi:hypothetical protein